MFTIEDICNIAIQIENNGESTYREVSKNSTNREIREMFSWMADEEKRHANWFSNFQSAKQLTPEEEEVSAMGKNLLTDMVKDQTFSLDQKALEEETNLYNMLHQSKELELDTILFYEFIDGLMSDEEDKEELQKIIAEEKKHARHITELMESLIKTPAI